MYKKILVPLDGSTLAERALPQAVEVASCMQSKVWLLRVSLSQDYVTSPAGGGALYPEEVLERDREGAAQYLKNVQARLRHDHPTLVVAIAVLAGPVAETIIDYAREQGVELIVMSSHGRSGLSRWVYGSVADKVLRGADCPTLIIRGQPAA